MSWSRAQAAPASSSGPSLWSRSPPRAAASTDLARHVKPVQRNGRGCARLRDRGRCGQHVPGPHAAVRDDPVGSRHGPWVRQSGWWLCVHRHEDPRLQPERLSGAGCPNRGDVPVLPTTAAITSPPVPASPSTTTRSCNRRSRTAARRPMGAYDVALNPGRPGRSGAARRDAAERGSAASPFPSGARQTVLLNPAGSRSANDAADGRRRSEGARSPGPRPAAGSAVLPTGIRVYFAVRFDRPVASPGTWQRTGSPPAPPGPTAQFADGQVSRLRRTARAGAYVGFAPRRSVEMRVGDLVRERRWRAAKPRAESSGPSLASPAARCGEGVEQALRRVEVSGGRREDVRTFYSMLYHALTTPTTFSDADGRYRGMDGACKSLAAIRSTPTSPGWDVYRSQMPLLGLIAPKMAADFVRSLVTTQREAAGCRSGRSPTARRW